MYIQQLDFLDEIPKEELLPCDSYVHDVIGCCNYTDTLDDYCTMGDKWIPRNKCGNSKVCTHENCAYQ
ncbi:hypothetical protein IAI10_16710 [Clostridium sp. 19966]|uniref:hypothetical protein n=1 Tax=Clostridium sp. 19966 TaxID=2768166 RepID=UPI0028DDBD65|nr:hypothetical protein [Clostridium sp. 19966]MDT8718311.1 hypothetical protein [Clostridium sp. 19966]